MRKCEPKGLQGLHRLAEDCQQWKVACGGGRGGKHLAQEGKCTPAGAASPASMAELSVNQTPAALANGSSGKRQGSLLHRLVLAGLLRISCSRGSKRHTQSSGRIEKLPDTQETSAPFQ